MLVAVGVPERMRVLASKVSPAGKVPSSAYMVSPLPAVATAGRVAGTIAVSTIYTWSGMLSPLAKAGAVSGTGPTKSSCVSVVERVPSLTVTVRVTVTVPVTSGGVQVTPVSPVAGLNVPLGPPPLAAALQV